MNLNSFDKTRVEGKLAYSKHAYISLILRKYAMELYSIILLYYCNFLS